jgi:uncharacterized membrane protein (UPF0127 family)
VNDANQERTPHVLGSKCAHENEHDRAVRTHSTPATSPTRLKASTIPLDVGGTFPEVGFEVGYNDPKGKPKTFCGCALLAATSSQQEQGLMHRKDLGGYDAMIFSFPTSIQAQFYMKTVPIDLSIGFFSENGKEVGRADMKSEGDCGNTCPLYGPKQPFRTAVEVQKGNLAKIGLIPGARLSYGGPCTKKNNRNIAK